MKTNETGYFFKFSSSLDFTLAYIDILNYKKELYDWNNYV